MGKTSPEYSPKIADIYKFFILFFAYFITAKLSFHLHPINEFAVFIWPPAGIAMACIFICGQKFSPSIFLAAFLVNWHQGAPSYVALGIGLGNTLEAVFAAFILKRFFHFQNSFEKLRHILWFLFIACGLAPMVSATIGVTSLNLAHKLTTQNFYETWGTWWMGDMLGIVIITPLLLTLFTPKAPTSDSKKVHAPRFALFIFGFLFFNFLAFNWLSFFKVVKTPSVYFVFPPLIWAALRLGLKGTTIAIFLTSLNAVVSTLLGFGPFDFGQPSDNFFHLQMFMVTSSITILITATLVEQRAQTAEVLQQREAQLLALQKHLRGIFESSSDAIAYATLDGKIIELNEAFIKLVGEDQKELKGQKKLQDFTTSEYQIFENEKIKTLLETGQTQEYEKEYITKDGTHLSLSLTVYQVRDINGKPMGIASIIKDITERKKNEEALRERTKELEQSNQELDDFAHIASHDLKEPLRGISHYSYYILKDYGDKIDDEGKKRLEMLNKLPKKMEKIINDLLNCSRLGRVGLAYSRVDINKIIDNVLMILGPLIEENKIEIVKLGNFPTLFCDEARVSEVFQNLITNAIKYSDKEKKIIEIGCIPSPIFPYIPTFFVKDNGIGIPKEFHESVFRLFKRLHAHHAYGGGSGAGLTIAKKIVEKHDGKIWIESKVGEGTTFYFKFGREKLLL